MSFLWCLLSYVWPIPIWHGRGKYGPLHLVWESGHLVVNSDKANQSYGLLHSVWQQCFSDAGLTDHPPVNILILGFGAGSVAHILRKELRLTGPITGVDGDPEMLRIAKDHFHVDRLKDLRLIGSDIHAFTSSVEQAYDLVIVDLCHELDLVPGVDEERFIQQLKKLTAPKGKLCFNTIAHDIPSTARCNEVGRLLRQYFSQVEERHYQGINRVFTAS